MGYSTYIILSGEPHNALHSPSLVIHNGNFHPLDRYENTKLNPKISYQSIS